MIAMSLGLVVSVTDSRRGFCQGQTTTGQRLSQHATSQVILSFLTLFYSVGQRLFCSSSFLASGALESPTFCAARIPALVAPGLPMATVATGIPAGICTVASSESKNRSVDVDESVLRLQAT